jgi:hypothetical protein
MDLRSLAALSFFTKRFFSTNYTGYWRQFSTPWLAAQNLISMRFGHAHRYGLLEAGYLLLSTAASPKRLKYDSVRAVAVKGTAQIN